jgi:hypothetical protein
MSCRIAPWAPGLIRALAMAFIGGAATASADDGVLPDCPRGLKVVRQPIVDEYYPQHVACSRALITATVTLQIAADGSVTSMSVGQLDDATKALRACVEGWVRGIFTAMRYEAPQVACIKVLRLRTVLRHAGPEPRE